MNFWWAILPIYIAYNFANTAMLEKDIRNLFCGIEKHIFFLILMLHL